MGLIERAGSDDTGEEPARASSLTPDAAAQPSLFGLDFEALGAQGFYTPQTRSERLSLELRSIKRRLLRRMGLRSAGERKVIRRSGRSRNLVLVTSTRPGEGKTFCAVNLALSLAFEEQIDTLLVDADLNRPKLRAHFGLPEGPGLADRIADPALPTASCSWRARQAPLSVLPEGRGAARPIELFAAAETPRVFAELSSRRAGRMVIIDAPPVLATEEAAVLAREADEIIFVIEADRTPHAAVAAALDETLDVNPNVTLLLNRCLIGAGTNYYGSYHDYGRSESGGGPSERDGAPRTQMGAGNEVD